MIAMDKEIDNQLVELRKVGGESHFLLLLELIAS
jgi:hypothetical protein